MKNFFKSRFSKERVARFFDREGFYIILFLCVCIVAITAVWVSRTGLRNEGSQDLGEVNENKTVVETPAVPEEITTAKNDAAEIPATEEVKVSEEADSSGTNSNAVQVVAQNTGQKASAVFRIDSPVGSETDDEVLVRDYSPDELVCFQNLNEWKTHLGIDLKAYEGSEVMAAADGKVIEVRDDNEYPGGLGWTVIIDHNNGYRSVYANLDENVEVQKDQAVKKGQKIGVVGNSSIYEKDISADASDEDPATSHLHFELLKRNAAKVYENVDPKEYFSMQN